MTAIRDRRSDPDAANEDAHIPWDERAALGARRGLPWWGAVLLAFGTAVVGAVLDTQINDGLSVLFHVIYLIGAVTAVGAVRRRNLFGPMVQPPLILAVTVPAVVLTGSGLPESSDTLAKLLAIGTPLINGFPMMAVTTALTVGLGLYRMYRERDPEASAKPRAKGARAEGTPKKRPDDARGAAKSAAGEAKRKPPAKSKPPESRDEGRAAGRGEPPRRGGQGTPGAAVAGAGAAGGRRRPEDAPPPRRARPADRDPGPSGGTPPRERSGRPARPPRVPPDAAERRRRLEEWPDSIPGPKRPRRPRGEEPPPGRGGADPGRPERPPRRRRPWENDG
ncbi:DUF6542 domain-containing protein [Prauserella oleivorans]|uniref:DUF6542 domain-containing protein n=1 Tax=Prauserella oleivorans TaxID=1478153 RepID=A0ABW5WEP7_9PSEU